MTTTFALIAAALTTQLADDRNPDEADVLTSRALNKLSFAENASQDLSGAGAIDLTKGLCRFTSTGAAQALTLADGTYTGQEVTILHVVDGGSGVLTAGAELHLTTGVATITLTNRWEWVKLRWTGALWDIIGVSPVAMVA